MIPQLVQSSRQSLFVSFPLMLWFILGSQMIMQDDSWWHLRTGEMIWETHSIPVHDTFSWVLPPGTFWPNHEWLAELLYFATYKFGSFPLVNFCGAMCFALTGYFLSQALYGPRWIQPVGLFLVLPWMVKALSVRPHLFTLLGITIFLFLTSKDRFKWLPILFFAWAQLHAGVVLCAVYLLIMLGFALLFDRVRFKQLLVPGTISIGVLSLNPLGPYLYLYPFAPFKRIEGLPIIEWMPPGFTSPSEIYFWFFAALFLVCGAIRWKVLYSWPAGPVFVCTLATLIPAIQHARHVYVWFLLVAVSLSYLFFTKRFTAQNSSAGREYSVPILIAWLCISSCVGWLLMHPSPRLGWQPLSQAGLRALKSAPMPTFNSYGTGGYILWFAPERKVFIDSRQDPYPSNFLHEAMSVQTSGDYENFFRRFSIKSAIVERPMPLVDALIRAGWRVTYDGRYFTVLVAPGN